MTRNAGGTAVFLVCCFLSAAASSVAVEPGQVLIRTSTHVGVDNVLRVGVSSDGVNFTDLFSTPTLTNYSRDASMARHGSDYVVVYTDQFLSTNGTFGLARSANLVDWTYVSSPRTANTNLITNMINNTWAPEWYVEDGRYYAVVRVSTTTNNIPSGNDTLLAPGHGYMECLDPGT